MESLCRGTSRTDAARGLMGHGWPFQAGPPERRCNEGTPAQLGPDVGARPFGYFWGDAVRTGDIVDACAGTWLTHYGR